MLTWRLWAAAAATTLLAATAVRADDAPMAIIVGSAQTEAGPGKAHAATAVQSEYWLGVFASRPAPALRAQLKLPKDQGLLVEALEPESPAAKAGLQQHDILLKGNDKPLADVGDLLQLIDHVRDGNLDLELLRAGKREIVTVTPAKRPANERGGLWISNSEGPAARSLNIGPNFMEGGPLEFRVIRPGQILPPGGPLPGLPGVATANVEVTVYTNAKLADGSKVEITQHGSEPAKVVVTHGKDKWEGTSTDLSKVPEKIRPEVEGLLPPALDHNRFFTRTGEGTMTIVGSAVAAPGFPKQRMIAPDVEKRLGEMQKQIDELRHSLDALQKNTQEKATPKPE